MEAETNRPVPAQAQLATGARIDINRATAEELEALPGIGPVLAKRIVEDREANGPFHTVDDLDRVKGIGEGILAKVRDHVTAGP
jgi:competence protein ComEA